ncbi:uncharacterized protein LOC114796116 [Denticeps clupeoides]|uniref:Cold shock domain-containing protein n=1 Tax=Denticeps clupeoides TaxID=299321 RepID=A0AAY4EA05_9TELE|nr:uncharacterized protein LOC114796116 [Denticeps clupeoides]
MARGRGNRGNCNIPPNGHGPGFPPGPGGPPCSEGPWMPPPRPPFPPYGPPEPGFMDVRGPHMPMPPFQPGVRPADPYDVGDRFRPLGDRGPFPGPRVPEGYEYEMCGPPREYERGPPLNRDFPPMDRGCGVPMMMERGLGPPACGPNLRPTMDNRGFGFRESGAFGPRADEFNPGFRRGFSGPPPPDMMDPGLRPMEPPEWSDPATVGPPRVPSQLDPPLTEVPRLQKKYKPVKAKSAKPPPGRSMGVITFIGNNHGMIERDDLKKFSFSFEAFLGDPKHLLPGVKVHFTACKSTKDSECGTDVIVPPGGTEDTDSTIHSGVITRSLIANQSANNPLLESRTGLVRAKFLESNTEFQFRRCDCKATLLHNDHVHFQIVTDVITQAKRATNVRPKVPETFQYTEEIREMGVIVDTKNTSWTITTQNRNDLEALQHENIGDGELAVMDEVEFTVIMDKGAEKAIRVAKLPAGTLAFGSKIKSKLAEVKEKHKALQNEKWKPVNSEVLPQRTVVFEDVSSEHYEGTIIKALTKAIEQTSEEKEPVLGLLISTVDGSMKKLPFEKADLTSQVTMLVGDKVQFNISTNRETKVERATNVEILSDSFHNTDSTEQRKIGVVMDLGESYGFIKCLQDPRLFFDQSEVMDENKLTISEKVEFTIVPNTATGAGNQAIRIKRLTENVLSPEPKLDGLGATNKEKKKMTIKLLRDPKEQVENLMVKVDAGDPDAVDSQVNELAEEQQDALGLRSSSLEKTSGDPLKMFRNRGERSHVDCHFGRENDWSRPHNSRSRSRSPSLDRGSLHHQSYTSRQESKYRGKEGYSRHSGTRSRSKERSYRRRYSRSRSRSRSQDRSGYSTDGRCAQSRSPEEPRSSYAPLHAEVLSSTEPPQLNSLVDEELARKKKELEELNELIARRRAIVAMEQKRRTPLVETKKEFDVDSESEEEMSKQWVRQTNARRQMGKPELQPIKSILKKRPEMTPTIQGETTSLELPQTPQMSIPYGKPLFPSADLQQSYFKSTPSSDWSAPHHTKEELSGSKSSHYVKPPVCQSPQSPPKHHQSTPVQHQAPETKNCLSTQMQRFLNTLNKGVDINVLSSLVKDTKKEAAPVVELFKEVSCRDEIYDPFEAGEEMRRSKRASLVRVISPVDETHREDLLPHERAVQDGSGFSRLVSMRHGLYVEEQFLRQSKVEEEEQYLYGKTGAEDDYNPYESLPRDERHVSPSPHTVESNEYPKEEKSQHFDKLQSLLQTIGLNLDTAEVSQLADRTRERLYGKKLPVKPPHSSHSPTSHVDRHRSRTASSESEGLHSVSPAKQSRRQVYMSYSDAAQSRELYDNMDKDLHTLTRTIKNTPDPQSTQKTLSSSAVSEGTQHSSDYTYPNLGYAYGSYSTPDLGQGTSSQYYTYQPGQTFPPTPTLAPGPYPGFPYGPPTVPPPIFPHVPPPQIPPPISAYHEKGLHSNYPGSILLSNPFMPPGTSYQQTKNFKQVPFQSFPTVKSRCLTVIETVTEVKNKDVTVPVDDETQETESDQMEIQVKQSGPLTEEDIKAKQKKRLEQFNQRMKQKKEQQMEAWRNRGRNKESTSGSVTCQEVKNVWICGHSLVFWAEKRAKSPEIGMQLGMDPNSVRVWWKGVQGMTWDQLLPQLLQLKGSWPNPDVLIIHLGGNDINKRSPGELMMSIEKDLESMRSIFPQCLLVWSDILPRRSWKHGVDLLKDVCKEMDSIRAMINHKVHTAVAKLGGKALTHDNIMFGHGSGLYRPDGIHLSGRGIDTFNLNLQDFLEKWESEAK